MSIDIEGAEFRVLPDLEDFASKDITICQLDAELHHPPMQKAIMTPNWKFQDFWKSFLWNTTFIPIKSSVVWKIHNKISFLIMVQIGVFRH